MGPHAVRPVPRSLTGRSSRVLCARTLGPGLGLSPARPFPPAAARGRGVRAAAPGLLGSCGRPCLGPHRANQRGPKDASSLSDLGQHRWCARGWGFGTDPVSFGKNQTCDKEVTARLALGWRWLGCGGGGRVLVWTGGRGLASWLPPPGRLLSAGVESPPGPSGPSARRRIYLLAKGCGASSVRLPPPVLSSVCPSSKRPVPPCAVGAVLGTAHGTSLSCWGWDRSHTGQVSGFTRSSLASAWRVREPGTRGPSLPRAEGPCWGCVEVLPFSPWKGEDGLRGRGSDRSPSAPGGSRGSEVGRERKPRRVLRRPSRRAHLPGADRPRKGHFLSPLGPWVGLPCTMAFACDSETWARQPLPKPEVPVLPHAADQTVFLESAVGFLGNLEAETPAPSLVPRLAASDPPKGMGWWSKGQDRPGKGRPGACRGLAQAAR